jgi:hypothetical protein
MLVIWTASPGLVKRVTALLRSPWSFLLSFTGLDFGCLPAAFFVDAFPEVGFLVDGDFLAGLILEAARPVPTSVVSFEIFFLVI